MMGLIGIEKGILWATAEINYTSKVDSLTFSVVHFLNHKRYFLLFVSHGVFVFDQINTQLNKIKHSGSTVFGYIEGGCRNLAHLVEQFASPSKKRIAYYTQKYVTNSFQ